MKLMKGVGIAAAVLLVAAVALFFAFAEAYRVPGRAMTPSLRPGDRILVLRFVGPVKPGRDDIVAYNVAGDRCGSPRNVVFVHRVARRARLGRFVMWGDNRRQACDSRVFGPVPREALIGRAVAVYWPPSHWGLR
jgi:signal peptidase I